MPCSNKEYRSLFKISLYINSCFKMLVNNLYIRGYISWCRNRSLATIKIRPQLFLKVFVDFSKNLILMMYSN